MLNRQKAFRVAAAASLESRTTDTEKLTPSGEAVGEREVQMDRSHLGYPGRPPVGACGQNRKLHRGTGSVRFRAFPPNFGSSGDDTHALPTSDSETQKVDAMEKIKRSCFALKCQF